MKKLGRPKKKLKDKKVPVTFRIDRQLWDEVKQYCTNKGSLIEFVETSLRQEIKAIRRFE